MYQRTFQYKYTLSPGSVPAWFWSCVYVILGIHVKYSMTNVTLMLAPMLHTQQNKQCKGVYFTESFVHASSILLLHFTCSLTTVHCIIIML